MLGVARVRGAMQIKLSSWIRRYRTITLTGFPAGEISEQNEAPVKREPLDTSKKPLSPHYKFLADQNNSTRDTVKPQVMISRRLSFEEQEAMFSAVRQKQRLYELQRRMEAAQSEEQQQMQQQD